MLPNMQATPTENTCCEKVATAKAKPVAPVATTVRTQLPASITISAKLQRPDAMNMNARCCTRAEKEAKKAEKEAKKEAHLVEPPAPPSTPLTMAEISEKEDGEISEHSDSEDEQGTVRVLTKSNGEEIMALDVNGVLYNQTTFEMIGSYDANTNTAEFIDES